ncbi:hypothetical protein E4U16_006394 [Claviceps sp. LM84 group G4]|nr:hypothetical protein E4U33_003262 [Claviceps sp. LM78 group G4]KAG6082239.1 hypothetical protein E4U16_006394 [Claviceps sp. LM84 group G4]
MDTNYKKITGKSGKVEHEVIFGGRVGLEGQFLALARAYMSSQDAVAYETLFRELFSCLERQCGVRTSASESIYTLQTQTELGFSIQATVCDIVEFILNVESSDSIGQFCMDYNEAKC